MQQYEIIKEIQKLLELIDTNRTDLRPGTRAVAVEKYIDSERFAREKAEIFQKHPLFLGFSNMLAGTGDYLATNYADVPLLIVRNWEGELRAFLNFCSHRGAPLVDGRGNVKKNFSCPYHAWRYNLDGELVTIPHQKNGFADLDKSCYGLQALQVEERLGMIFVMPDPESDLDLDTYLHGLGDDLETWDFGSKFFLDARQIPAKLNWKLNLDTFGETYHFSSLHPETFFQTTHENISTSRDFPWGHRLICPSRDLESKRNDDEESWNSYELLSVIYYLFPNTILFLVRGHIQVFTIVPGKSVTESTTYHQTYMLQPPSSEEEEADFLALADLTEKVLREEDYAVVEKIQTNLQGVPGRKFIFGQNELKLQRFHELIDEAI